MFWLNIGTRYLLGRDSCTSFLELRIPGSQRCSSSALEENHQFLKEIVPLTPAGMGYKGTNVWLSFFLRSFLKSSSILFHFDPHTWGCTPNSLPPRKLLPKQNPWISTFLHSPLFSLSCFSLVPPSSFSDSLFPKCGNKPGWKEVEEMAYIQSKFLYGPSPFYEYL